MAGKTRTKTSRATAVPDDWEAVVRQAVLALPGVKATAAELKKALPASYQKLGAQALTVARELAERGELHLYLKGKTPHFFPRDPLLELDELLLAPLADSPLGADELKERAGPYAPALDAWLKRALAQKKLFERSVSQTGKKTKNKAYSTEPDVRASLAAVLKALGSALQKTAAQGISNEQVARVLLSELGVAVPGASSNGAGRPGASNGKRGAFLGALQRLAQERPREALLPVRELLAWLALEKEEFDALALELMRDGAISLHHHDHPGGLSELERAQLVKDARGTFYIGIAPRSGA
jgi:hypothetical protein